ncbi:MAG: phosphoribosylformylglycinamidine cyclo-ligase [Chitinivibrionales bacterium]|nr:phosphoribosylformylglycinamidine cyclo-ligase [Chitinivibrionales bacterium]
MSPKPVTYADAGVSIDTWNSVKGDIGKLVASTYNDKVVGRFGQFGGMFDISSFRSMQKPVLVSSVDGVGTKLKIAIAMGRHETVGQDIVNHCVNDIAVLGARALFFLDYIATGKLLPEITRAVIAGMATACKSNNCVLIGGETAEMPDFYARGDYDIAGTIVGIVDEAQIVDGRAIASGDRIIGLRSNGLHTNGYSLARKIVTEIGGMKYEDAMPGSEASIGAELLKPHRSYAAVLDLMQQKLIKGCAHITGGGFVDNIDRILPSNCDAAINAETWEPLPIFKFLQRTGNVENAEMFRTFNMGIGMVLVVDKKDQAVVLNSPIIREFGPVAIGEITPGTGVVNMQYS